MRYLYSRRGFTLIELLVVISIIGLLTTLALVAISNSQMRARDAKRRADLQQIAKALESYYDDNNAYPSTDGSWYTECDGTHERTGANGWIPNLAPTYLQILPADPKPTAASGYCYRYYSSDGTEYKINAFHTVESGSVPNTDPMFDPRQPRVLTFAVYTPGGRSY